MPRIKLSLKWLNQQLELLCVYNENFYEKVLAFKNDLKNVASDLLQKEQWHLSEFLILAIVFNLMEELCSDNKTIGSIYRSDWANHRGVPRSLMVSDIRVINRKFIRYYREKFKLLKQLCKTKEMNISATPINWLELAESIKSDLYVQRYVTTYEMTKNNPSIGIEVNKKGGMSELIRSELAKLIRYKAFSLTYPLDLTPRPRYLAKSDRSILNGSKAVISSSDLQAGIFSST